jgi:YidC/Oxa1 family membrane protein insertase
MKIFPVAISLLAFSAEAFAPSRSTVRSAVSSTTQRHVFDPSAVLGDVHQQMDTLANMFSSSSMALSDAAEATAEVAKNDNGWFGFLEGPIEFILKGIHATLVGMGMNEDAWGVTIIAMTTLIKLATYPLTKSQLESTNKMQVRFTR